MSSRPTSMTRRPLLVLVAGAPATGKTTLARHLSDVLRLPLLSKDPVREILAEGLGVQSFVESRILPPIAFRILYAVVAQLLSAGVGAVVEANFFRGTSEPELRLLVQGACAVLVHCQTPENVSMRRFVERFEQGGRHWSSSEGERAEIRAGQRPDAWDRAEPLDADDWQDLQGRLLDAVGGYTRLAYVAGGWRNEQGQV